MTNTEQMGRALAQNFHKLGLLDHERKEAMKGFAMRKETLLKEIAQLAEDMRTGQSGLYPNADRQP